MHHLVAEEAGPDLAEEAHALALLELLHLARIEIEEAHPQVFLAVGELQHEGSPRAVLHLGCHDLGLHQHGGAGLRILQRRELRLVFVAQRHVQHEVRPGADAELLEARGERRAREYRGRRQRPLVSAPRWMTASISTSAPRGREATPMAARAG